MTLAKHGWRRRALLFSATALALGVAGAGCGSSGGDTGGGATGPSSSSAGGSSTTSNASSTSGTGATSGTGSISSITPAGGSGFKNPYDSTPDSTGKEIYFTAYDVSTGAAGVFKVAASGGASTALASGEPLEDPLSIAISSDDKTLFVADYAAELDNGSGPTAKGAIFTLSTDGGTPAALSGTAGYRPRGVEVAKQNGKDMLFFTGSDPKDPTKAGVYSVSTSGGTPTALAVGAPFVDPSSVAIASNGDVFVSDSTSAGSHLAEVYRVPSGGAPELLATDLRVGQPAGVALSLDDETLLVSGLDPVTRADVVFEIDLSTKEITTISGKVGATDLSKNFEAAGVHRAKAAQIFSWADSKASPMGMTGTGTVFVIK